MVKTERLVSYVAVVFLLAVFGFAFVSEATKKPEIWTIKVFDTYIKDDPKQTYVYSYGQSYRIFEGEYTFFADHTYKIVYKITAALKGRILSVEEVL